MNVWELLENDHDKMDELFEQFENLKEDPDKNDKKLKDLFAEIRKELEGHMEGEENFLYPPLRDSEDTRSEVFESIEEHHVVKILLREIDSVQMGEKWVAKMSVLKENAKHHNDEEEEDLFPPGKKILNDDQAVKIAEQISALKKEMARN